MPERIFILNGHPGPSSITRQALDCYSSAARAAGHEVRLSQLADLDFDPDRGKAGYAKAKPLEPVLEQSLENLEWCSHFVPAFPLWWGGFPAKLKGWIGRVDEKAQENWDLYTKYKEKMYGRTHTTYSPWIIVKSNDKKKARLESMRYLLAMLEYRARTGRSPA